jgi:5-methylcytosine-specific restriction endonuclease McrA
MSVHKTLLLNYSNEILGFVAEKKAIRLIYKGKAEIVSVWKGIEYRSSSSVYLHLPSILRMKYYVRKNHTKVPFSRKAVLKRDRYTCAYCLKNLSSSSGTIDHIIPRKFGGQNSFLNCVAACFGCNSRKSHRSIEEAGMTLVNKPFIPSTHTHYLMDDDIWHEDWKKYL